MLLRSIDRAKSIQSLPNPTNCSSRSIIGFILFVTVITVGPVTVPVFLLGLPVLAVGLAAARGLGDVERRRLAELGRPLPPVPPFREQREGLRGGARKAVAEAHVVLTNPTHFAVALRYDRGRDQVPVVVAKGRGATALAIRELAAESRVPVLEYPLLARAVYYTSKENQEVRDDLYMAIATVLAFVFGLNAAAGGTPMPQPAITVPVDARFDENGMKQA